MFIRSNVCSLATHVFLGEQRHWVISVQSSPRNVEPCGAAAGKMTVQWKKKHLGKLKKKKRWKKLTRNMFFLLSWSTRNESGWQQKKAGRNVCDAACLCSNAQQIEDNNKIWKYSQRRIVLQKSLHCLELKYHLSRFCQIYCKFFFKGNGNWKKSF